MTHAIPRIPTRIRTGTRALALACLLAAGAAGAQARGLTVLHDFTASPDGREPAGSVTPLGGMLYGTTNAGGVVDGGTLYRLDPATGALTVLHSFKGTFNGATDGSAPVGELLAVHGQLYGTTSFGGTFGAGTLFRFNPATGHETVLFNFGGSDADGAAMPGAGPTLLDGRLYGTTSSGGTAGVGTVFEFDPATRAVRALHSFQGGEDGASPFAPLEAVGGTLYGTTYFGGASNNGTVFGVDAASGAESVLHAFTGPSFSGNPSAGLTYGAGQLYGTTAHGGLRRCGGGGCGTVFRVDVATGVETDVYQFSSPRDGQDPEGGLVLDQGRLYGTTLTGGPDTEGTAFVVDLATGRKKTLATFDGAGTGSNPGTLVRVQGVLYGTAHGGGGAGQGTVFDLAR